MKFSKLELLIISIALILLLSVASYIVLSSRPLSSTETNQQSGQGSLHVGSVQPQGLSLYKEPEPDSDKASVTPSQNAQSNNAVHTSPSKSVSNDANLNQYLPSTYQASPAPSFDYGREAPTLSVPPKCVSIPDSSYNQCQ